MNFRISSDDTGHYIVYLNGAISEIIARDDYEALCRGAVDDGVF